MFDHFEGLAFKGLRDFFCYSIIPSVKLRVRKVVSKIIMQNEL